MISNLGIIIIHFIKKETNTGKTATKGLVRLCVLKETHGFYIHKLIS